MAWKTGAQFPTSADVSFFAIAVPAMIIIVIRPKLLQPCTSGLGLTQHIN
jgi:hypothetical protein